MSNPIKVHYPDAPNMPASPCPNCGVMLNAASTLGEKAVKPTPKDAGNYFFICIECGAINTFDENLMLREPTAGELMRGYLDEHTGPILRQAKRDWPFLKAMRGRVMP